MRQIHKYTLSSFTDNSSVGMPQGAKILSVQEQHDSLVVWAEVDESLKHVIRNFYVAKTGLSYLPEEATNFVGTVQLQQGNYVVHVYDMGEEY